MALNVTLTFSGSAGQGPISGIVVHRYQLRDAMSELFELSIQLASTDPAVDMHSIVGEAITVACTDDPGQPQVEGIVRGVRQLSSVQIGSGTTLTASGYEVVVVPPLWLTTRRRDHRIFENKNAADIVADVLAGYGGRIPAPARKIGTMPQERDYVVQHGETDYDFITRVLAADFLASFFDHANKSAFTLIDDTAKMTSAPSATTQFIPPSNLITPPAHVFNVVVSSNIETSIATVRDYDYEHSLLELEGKETATPASDLFKGESDLDGYFFEVGEFVGNTEGKTRAKHTLEALRARARTYTMEANFTAGPGTQLKLSGHPRSDANDTFLVVRVRIIEDDGAQRGLLPLHEVTNTHVLECIRATIPFLPAPKPKPKIYSTEVGTIVGGEDGDVVADSMSRVNVLFKWDRQKNVSKKTRPVRVSQAWAGTAYGFFALPRVGDEVVIGYLDGDPDEPLVVGRVHNNARVNPVDPTGQGGQDKTISKWRSQTIGDPSGFNEVLMDDLKGKERLDLHSQRDFKSIVEHDSVTIVKHDEWLTVGHNKTDKIERAYSMSAGSVSIGCGPYTLTASKIKMTAKTTVLIKAGDEIKLECGGSSITLTPGSIVIDGPVVEVKGKPIKLN